MEYKITEDWDDELWQQAEPIYNHAFLASGGKPYSIIRGMFRKRMCMLHVAVDSSGAVAMAITSRIKQINTLLIDYFAVKEELRGTGIGQRFITELKSWARTVEHLDGIILEIEAEKNSANRRRAQFWLQSGFQLTDYQHSYIWVPEPYQAMYINLHPDADLPRDGKALFRYITRFHNEAYRGKG
jgi:GNAT superfamily N-acetyltransferase